ncbi:unnamed protein product [Auanema sp. JU1783]|nr:unnamed protein product [Auanema sp. JU1783]
MVPNLSVFKYPLGVIRVVEFLFIVLAIAAVNSWSVTVNADCPVQPTNNESIKVHIEARTFTLSDVKVQNCNKTEVTFWKSDNNAGGSAGFFYFTNVTALIYVLVITFIYVIFWEVYQHEKRLALADLAITALLFVFFFFCSSIWWAGSNTLGSATSEKTINELLTVDGFWGHGGPTLSASRDTNNGKLVISVICDWACVLLFAFNCWFVWKEIVPRPAENPSQIA